MNVITLFLAACLAFAEGPAAPPVKAPQSAPGKTTNSTAASSQQDRETKAAIRAKLARSKIGKDGFTVRVQGGTAYWEGSTGVVQHEGAATRMAKTAGAKQVVNRIQISDAAREKASGNLETGRRRAQVTRGEERTK